MRTQIPPPDERIADLASRQHGLVAHRQLAGLGIKDGAVKRRVAAGRLHVIHRGVYAVGHAHLTLHGDWMAAVLAGDEDALLSHWSAARLWVLAGGRLRPIHVTVARNGGRKSRGVQFHHPRSLHPEDRAVRSRIPVTSVERTLLDLAGEVDAARLTKLFDEAIRIDLLDPAALARLLDRSSGRRGVKRLRLLLEEELHLPDDTRPGIEAELATFLRARGFPVPVFNALVEGRIVDAFWAKQNVIVEMQSRAFHQGWRARENDMVRAAELQALGYRVLPISTRQLRQEPDKVERVIRMALANAEGPRDGGPSETAAAAEAA